MTRATTMIFLTLALTVVLGCCDGGRCMPTDAPAEKPAPATDN